MAAEATGKLADDEDADLANAALTAEPAVTSRRTAFRLHRGRVALPVGALLAALLAAGWWFTHPTPVKRYGSGVTLPAPVGQPEFVMTGIVPDVTPQRPATVVLTVDSVTPRISQDTSQAKVDVMVCDRRANTAGIGVQANGLEVSCTRAYPLRDGQSLSLGNDDARELFVRVTAKRPGRLVISGYDVRYHQGLRFRWQRSGFETIADTR